MLSIVYQISVQKILIHKNFLNWNCYKQKENNLCLHFESHYLSHLELLKTIILEVLFFLNPVYDGLEESINTAKTVATVINNCKGL